jgi:hypothetical protein
MNSYLANLIVFGLGTCIALSPLQGYAQTASGPGPNECFLSSAVPNGNCTSSGALTNNNTFFGARSDTGSEAFPIDINVGTANDWHLCRYVDSTSSVSYFVPFHSKPEWTAFLTALPSGVTVTHCARPVTFTITPGGNCALPSPASIPANLPYARVGTTQTITFKFTCSLPYWTARTPSPTWNETMTITFTALDSDTVTPSWKEGTPTYAVSQS